MLESEIEVHVVTVVVHSSFFQVFLGFPFSLNRVMDSKTSAEPQCPNVGHLPPRDHPRPV